MRRVVAGVVLGLLGLVAVLAVYAYQRVRVVEHRPVAGDVHLVRGLGGNVAVLRTDRGAVVVDTMMFRMQGERLRKLAERLGGGPVQAILNTHYHRDHTHGNPAFPAGMPILAAERTLEHLQTLDAGYWRGAAAQTLPNQLVERERELRIGGKTVRAYHLGSGHTDGDLVVLFVEDRVAAVGDLVFHRFYPRVDLEAGGSIRAWIDTLDRVLALEFDKVIPGHGEPTDRAGIRDFQELLREVWAAVQDAVASGKTMEQTVEALKLQRDAGYGTIGIPGVWALDRDGLIRSTWREADAARSARP